MSEILIPPWIIPEEEPQEPLDEGSSVFNAAFAPGLTQRQSYGGMRLKLSRRHTVRLEEKAQLLSALRSTRGRYNVVRSKVHFALRGSFPATELLTNNTFANGASGWTALGASLSVNDRIMRVTSNGGFSAAPSITQSGTVTQYAAYVIRGCFITGLGSGAYSMTGSDSVIGTVVNGGTSAGLQSQAIVPSASPLTVRLLENSGRPLGDFFLVPYASLSRCALVDTPFNGLIFSNQFDNAVWTKSNSTVTANTSTSYDGVTNADSFNENTTNAPHAAYQSCTVAAGVADFALTVIAAASNRNWMSMIMQEGIGNTNAKCYFNVQTGTVGTATAGANWSNIRTFVANLGGGWFACTVVARKTNAATTIFSQINSATADGTDSYAGVGTQTAIVLAEAQFQSSSVPNRVQRTTTVQSSAATQIGSALYVKGLPASTNGLLLPEDVFEINGELKTCTAALNSDAAGLGYLQFEPALVRSPADNDPVIILDPMGKFLMSNLKIDNEFGTQAKVSYDLEHIYE